MTTIDKPILDITTLNAVESLFRGGTSDPWAKQTAGELVDFIVYAERPRYILPCADDGTSPPVPGLLASIQAAEPGLFQPEMYLTADPRQLAPQYLSPSFQRFTSWTKANKNTLRRWATLHREAWIRGGHLARVKHAYVFEPAALRQAGLEELAKEVGVGSDDLCYAFDVMLRYPLYGELAGRGERYLNHPIRDAFRLPTMEELDVARAPIPLSFKISAADWAPRLKLEEFTRIAFEIRDSVRQAGIHNLRPGEFDVQAVRDLAGKMGIPPTLKSTGKWAAVAGGVVAGLGAIPALGPVAAVAGAMIAVGGALWSGRLPSAAGRVQWLRWSMEWRYLESQAEHRE